MSAAPDTAATWRSSRFAFASVYDFVIERERLAQGLGRVLWGNDTRLVYRDMAAIGALPDGAAVLDAPCGGGVAFRALRPDQRVRYVGADISPVMLARARDVARRRRLHQVELVHTDIVELPLADEAFDLVCCFNALHNLSDPRAAIRELIRCLKPRGRFLCNCAVLGEGARFDALFELYRRKEIFGAGATAGEIASWLEAVGLRLRRFEVSGAILHVDAVRSG